MKTTEKPERQWDHPTLDPEPPRMIVGITWYRRQDWDRLLRMFPDRKTMHDSFDDWLSEAENLERQMKASGVATERVIIDPDGLRAWCKARGVPANGKARATYTTQKVRQAHGRNPA
jgi:hypothetical protein